MNVELMLKVADYIEAYPEHYNQSEWCGTECCIAGHALALHFAVTPSQLMHKLFNPPYYLDSPTLRRVIMNEVPEQAAEVLDLDEHMAGVLFSAGNWPEPFRFSSGDRVVHALGGRCYSAASRKAAAFLRCLVAEHQRMEKPLLVEEHDEELVLA